MLAEEKHAAGPDAVPAFPDAMAIHEQPRLAHVLEPQATVDGRQLRLKAGELVAGQGPALEEAARHL